MNLTQSPNDLREDLLTSDPELFAQPQALEKWRARRRNESAIALKEKQKSLEERAAVHRSQLEKLIRKILVPLADQVADTVGLDREKVKKSMGDAVIRWTTTFGDAKDPGGDFPYYDDATPKQRDTIRRILRKREQVSRRVWEFEREWFAIEVVLREAILSERQESRFQRAHENAEHEKKEAGEVEKDRTVSIGKALIAYGNEEEETPNFHGSKEQFKEWAGNVIEKGKTTAYNALTATGCWENPKPGDSEGLKKILDRTMKYAEGHVDISDLN